MNVDALPLTGQEVLVLAWILGLSCPPISLTSQSAPAADLDAAVRDAVAGSLGLRGLVRRDADGLHVAEAVAADLRLLLGSPLAQMITVEDHTGHACALLGGDEARIAELTPARVDGLLCHGLASGAPAELVSRYAERLRLTAPPEKGAAGSADDPRVLTVTAVRQLLHPGAGREAEPESANPAEGATVPWLVTLRGLRLDPQGAAAFDLAWLDTADGGFWRLSAAGPDAIEVSPWTHDAALHELRLALGAVQA